MILTIFNLLLFVGLIYYGYMKYQGIIYPKVDTEVYYMGDTLYHIGESRRGDVYRTNTKEYLIIKQK